MCLGNYFSIVGFFFLFIREVEVFFYILKFEVYKEKNWEKKRYIEFVKMFLILIEFESKDSKYRFYFFLIIYNI